MLVEGRYEHGWVGPIVDVAVGSSREWAWKNAYCLSWVRGAFDRERQRTSIRNDLLHDLFLHREEGSLKVFLLFRDRPDGPPVLFRNVEVDSINASIHARQRELLRHDSDIQVVFGQDVLGCADLVMFPDVEGEGGTFLFSVDTGTGITPVARDE